MMASGLVIVLVIYLYSSYVVGQNIILRKFHCFEFENTHLSLPVGCQFSRQRATQPIRIHNTLPAETRNRRYYFSTRNRRYFSISDKFQTRNEAMFI